MYNFILQTIFMVSLGAIIYLVARALPRIDDVAVKTRPRQNYFDLMMKRVPIEKADAFVNMLLEKTLRKSKIFVMKLDNFLNTHLKSLRPGETSRSGERPNIFEKKADSDTVNK
jgi:hypothetical protein